MDFQLLAGYLLLLCQKLVFLAIDRVVHVELMKRFLFLGFPR